MFLRRESNQSILNLAESALLGTGGEARIYSVPNEPELAAKIYHQPDEAYAHKLAAMLANPPHDPAQAQGHASIVWPIELLRSLDAKHQVSGFLMPRVHRMRCVMDVYHPGTRRKQAPLFNYAYLHRTARNLAAAVGALHAGGYVIGDVNESNVLVSETALVTLVDTDSFQVRDPANGNVYRSPVGKAEFTPPELQGKVFSEIDRLPEHDLFGLAVLIFQLLMEGTHPFAGVYTGPGEPPPIEARILAGHFPYGAGKHAPYRPMPAAPPLGLLTPQLRQLFIRCFISGFHTPQARPSAATWQEALKEAEVSLQGCARNSQHLFGKHLAECPWCKRAQQLGGRDPFPSPAAIQRGLHLQALPRKTKRVIHPTFATQRAHAAQTAYTNAQITVPAYTPILGLTGQPPAPPPPSLFNKLWNATRFSLTGFMMILILQSLCSPGMQVLTETARRAGPPPAPLPMTRPQKMLRGHAGRINALAVAPSVTPDEQTLATGSADRTIKLWDGNTGETKLTLEGQQDELSALAFSPDGKLIAGGAYNGALLLWGTQTGQLKRTLPRHAKVITALAFAPDGQTLVSCGRDQLIVQWDVKTGQPLREIEWASRWMSAVVFSPDGRLLLVADDYGAVLVFDLPSGTVKQTFVRHDLVEPPTDRIRTLTLSPDGQLVAFGFLGSYVEVWHLAEQKLVRRLRNSDGIINTVAFSPDSQRLLSGNHNGTFTLWQVPTGAVIRSWRAHTSGVSRLAFAPDGQRIFSTAEGTPYTVNVFE
jgi:WD40 repeat protein/serine/threonine protein kinase